MHRIHVGVVVTSALVAASASASVIQFMATDGNKLFRADSTGHVDAPITLSAHIQSLTFVPGGFSIPGAGGGTIVACAADPVAGKWAVYRMDDPAGAATLVKIGETTFGVGSLAFGNDGMYGVDASANPIRVRKLSSTDFSTTQTWSTGVNVSGGGGLAFDRPNNRFLLTDATNNRLMNWTPGNNATSIGNIGFGFSNNGVEFIQGDLFGALRPDSPGNTLRFGKFNTATGAFTTLATTTGIVGNGTGFVAIPAPATLALAGLGMFTSRRRR
ncbi:MAG: hypothetical protein IT432_13030 [Phycisphaerales bacterium]|nr:hypothetical protein [Phycisphaerales bacterium]